MQPLLRSLLGLAALVLLVGLLPLYPLLEAAWYLACQWRLWKVNRTVPDGAAVTPAYRRSLQLRILNLGLIINIEQFFSGWFRGAAFRLLKRGDIEAFVAYGIYSKKVQDLDQESLRELRNYVEEVENKFDFKFPPGRARLPFMAHLWEPIRYLHKPLLLHLAAELLSLFVGGMLHLQGFQRLRCGRFHYWLFDPDLKTPPQRSPFMSPVEPLSPSPELAGNPDHAFVSASPNSSSSGSDASLLERTPQSSLLLDIWDSASECKPGCLVPEENSPIVFLHGVGLGMAPYLHFLAELRRAFPSRAFLILDIRHVGVNLSTESISTDECALAVVDLLRANGFRQAAFVCHSYGTFVASRICQLHRQVVQSMALIDPVCMLCIYPQLLQNFVYKLPSPFHSPFHGAIDCLRYLFARDLTIATIFCRQFIWHRECLWPEDFPEALLLVLSAADDLVPTPLVQAQVKLAGATCQVMTHSTAGHGGFLLKNAWRAQIVAKIQATVERGACLAAKAAC